MIFTTIPEDTLTEILDEYANEDILSDELRKMDDLFDRFSTCQKCGSHMTKRLHPTSSFSQDSLIPNMILHCDQCGYEHDPKTGIIISVGDTSKAIEQVRQRRIPILDPSKG